MTYITDVRTGTDETGRVSVSITGRGFSEGGSVSHIVLDRDGKEPFDYRFSLESGAFKVTTDRLIENF